ncbi:MAG: hypothetical protein ABIJ50_09080 [Pseudomonadota bacterium]
MLLCGLALLSLLSATAVMAEDKVVVIPMGSSGVGTVVTSISGESWFAHNSSPTTVSRYVTTVLVSGDGKMVLGGLHAPASIDGVAYGLETIELCVDVTAPGYLDYITVYRHDSATSAPVIMANSTARTTDGCYIYPVNASTGKGVGIILSFAGGGDIRINGTTFTWKKLTALAASAAPAGPASAEATSAEDTGR